MARSSIDRLSLLPDEMLLLILSLLPFKHAIRMCVLSKRWSAMVKSFSNIELNEEFFVEHDAPEQTREAQRSAFLEFAASWISKYQERVVNKFLLKLSTPENASEFISRGILSFLTGIELKESLELDFSSPDWNDNDVLDDPLASVELPGHVYGQMRELEYLKLYSCRISEANSHNFHALREVSLGWMEVTPYVMRTLLSNCVMLEVFSLKRCWNETAFDLDEDGMRLRKLVLDRCHFHFDFVRINAPLLTVFRYSGTMNYFHIESDLALLEEVELDLSSEYEFEGYGPVLHDLVEGLYSVRAFTVCSYLLQVVPSGGHPLRTQRDLSVRHLILKTALHEDEYFGIAFLLNSCPMLERLTIEIGLTKILLGYLPPIDVDHQTFWRNNVSAYRCLMLTLKEVEIKAFKGSMSEVVLLTHIIAYGRVLKKMCINVLKESGEDGYREYYRTRVAQVLLTVPKASSDLEILII